MLAIGRALVTNPKLLIMDEPSEGLAPTIIEMLIETFRKLEQEGLRILLIEQNLGVATALAERQLVMVGGEIAAETTATQISRRPGAPAPLPRRRAGRALTMRRSGSWSSRWRRCSPRAAAGSSGPKGPPALVFVSVKDGDYAIFGADADGKHTYRLTDARRPIPSTPEGLFFQNEPAWSPDGQRDRLHRRTATGRTHIFVMNADGTGTRRVTNDAAQRRASDVVARRPLDRLRRAKARSSACARAAAPPGASATGFGAAADPAYSPDGKLIAYDYRRPGFSIQEIYVMNADGTGVRQRDRPPRRQHATRRGRRTASTLAFQSNAAGSGQNEIYTVPLAGGTPKRVTTSDDRRDPARLDAGRERHHVLAGTARSRRSRTARRRS